MKKNDRVQNDILRIKKTGVKPSIVDDIYFTLMNLTWPRFFCLILLYFVAINLFFGYLYYLKPESVSVPESIFWNYFFFSVQTFSTIGYGGLYPQTNYAHWLVLIESFIGVLSTAMITGCFFAKFSKPRSKIVFSQNILRTKYNNKDILMMRVANFRSNIVMNANFKFFLLYDEVTSEGKKMRRFDTLKISKHFSPIFSLSFSLMHELEDSPISKIGNITNEEILVTVSGEDETYSQTIHGRAIYKIKDIIEAKGFKDILHIQDDGTRLINFKDFNHIIKE